MTDKPDMLNHPPHYQKLSECQSCSHPIECIDDVENMNNNLGNAVKYVWRAERKGNTVEDLEKAVWYLNREIARRRKLR